MKYSFKEDFSKINGEGTILRKAQLRLLEMLVEFDRICCTHDIPYMISGGTCLGAVRHGGFIPWDDDVDIDVMRSDYKKLIPILKRELNDNFTIQTKRNDEGFYQVAILRIVDKNSKIEYKEKENKLREKLVYRGLFIDIIPNERVFSYTVAGIFNEVYRKTFYVKRGLKLDSFFYRMLANISWLFLKIGLSILRFLGNFTNKERISNAYGTGFNRQLKYSNLFPPKPIIFEGKEFLGPAKPHEYLSNLYGGNYMEIPPPEKREVHAEKIEFYDS